MSFSRLLFVALALTGGCLSGCGGDPPVTINESVVPPPPIAERLAVADLERGRAIYIQCRACHSLNEGGPAQVGPNLYGIFGRKPGLAPGFPYSDALAQAEFVWTVENMDGWLADPGTFLPGNRMIFVGIKHAGDRASLIAYLQQETGTK